jgi:hypothetical protein
LLELRLLLIVFIHTCSLIIVKFETGNSHWHENLT